MELIRVRIRPRIVSTFFALLVLSSSLLVVALKPAPAHATTNSIVNCGPILKPINNSPGRLEVYACVHHEAGGYSSYGHYACFVSGTNTGLRCNLGVDDQMFFWDTPSGVIKEDDIAVSRLGLNLNQASWGVYGHLESCTGYQMFSQIQGFSVRFPDGTLWTNSTSNIGSYFTQGNVFC